MKSDVVSEDASAPGLDAAASWSIQLDVFEGPLDLLLHLVKRHELDVLDIPVAFITQKYLEYLEFLRALDLDVAGEYLVMAATLAYLKSRELLPRDPVAQDAEAAVEEGVDPREDLVRRLLEYQTFRDAAQELDALPVAGRDVFSRGSGIALPPTDPELAPITLFRLADAFHRVLQRARIEKTHEVVAERVSVPARMRQLTLLMIERPKVDFVQLFLERTWTSENELRSALVVTLISVLELVRLGVARVHQPDDATTILIERIGDPDRERIVLDDEGDLESLIESENGADEGERSENERDAEESEHTVDGDDVPAERRAEGDANDVEET